MQLTATNRAMARKVFEDLGIAPPTTDATPPPPPDDGYYEPPTDIPEGLLDEHIDIHDREEPHSQAPSKIIPTPFVLRDPGQIPPREWLYASHYIRKFVTATI